MWVVCREKGADDDGSGCANFMEVLRVLMNSGYQPRRTLEFIGWAAEEVGLRGANEIAQVCVALAFSRKFWFCVFTHAVL